MTETNGEKYLLNKINRRTNFPNLFFQETLHVSGSFSAHHREVSTVHSALVYVMQVLWQLSNTTWMELCSILVVLESSHQTCMTYTSAECTVETSRWWAEKLPETCRVSWQNKFGKLVRLLILLKEICYDARSHERKRRKILYIYLVRSLAHYSYTSFRLLVSAH